MLIFRLCVVFRPVAIDTVPSVAVFFSFFLFFPQVRCCLQTEAGMALGLPAPLHYPATGFQRLHRLWRLICRGSERIVSRLMNPVTQSLSQSATRADRPTRRVANAPFFVFILNFIFPERGEGQRTRLSRCLAHSEAQSDLIRLNSWPKVA